MNSIIPDLAQKDSGFSSLINKFFKNNSFSTLLKRCNFYKESGVPCYTVLKELFQLVFTEKNLYRTLESRAEDISFSKNTAYRFLNAGHFNWAKLLLLLATRLIVFINSLTSDNRQSVIIFDDTLYSRSRSKKVELLSRVFDHTTHKFVKGFRMLTMGWSDGNTFMPVGFSLLSSQKPEKILSPAIEIDKRTLAHRRRAEASQCTTDVLIKLLKSAAQIPAKYVLFDSWFAYPKTIVRIIKEKRDVICMLKKTENIHYLYEGKWQPLKEIRKKIENATKSPNGIIGSVKVQIRESKKSTNLTDVRLIFIQDRRSKDWLALLSTDLELPEEEVIRVYGKRWDIEVFFKMCKSHLALAKEYQGRSFDGQVAAASIVFLRYAMLAIESRESQDARTIGGLFYCCCDEMEDVKLAQSLILLIDTLRQTLHELPVISQEIANQIMDLFIATIPLTLKQKLLLVA
jgi:hypothetical protein